MGLNSRSGPGQVSLEEEQRSPVVWAFRRRESSPFSRTCVVSRAGPKLSFPLGRLQWAAGP